MLMSILLNMYHLKAPTNWVARTTATLFFVILLLIGYNLYSVGNHIVKVEDDFHEMEELKVRVEATDVAKSQVLINEVLDRARIEAGKLELEAVPFDLRSILDDVLYLITF
ncbi:hypothetical protein RYX36_028086 [Vicia faba]